MYFWLSYSNKIKNCGRILVVQKKKNHSFYRNSNFFESVKIHMFLLSDGIQMSNK